MSGNDKREKRAALWSELQAIAEHNGELTSDMANDFDRIEAEIRDLDAGIRADSVRERFERMSTEPARPVSAPGARARAVEDRADDDWSATLRYWRTGGRDMSGLQRRDLNTSDDSAVVPSDLAAEVVRLMGAAAGARQAVRVTMAPTDMRIPLVSTRVSVTADTAEGTAADETEPTFSVGDFTTDKKGFAVTELTDEVLQDARIDLVSEVTLQHAEELGRFWSSKYCNGLGANTDAIFENGASAVTNQLTAASASAVTAAELINMRYGAAGLPAQYWNSFGPLSWIMGQDTYAAILGLTDTTLRPLFQPYADSTMSQAIPGTLLGLPVHIDASAPAFSTGNAVIALVAQNAYRVVDREPGLVTRLDPYSRQSEGIVKVNSYWRSVGRWVRPEAGVVLSLA